MGYKIVQCIGLVCTIIGILGTAGAIELETRLMQPLALLTVGALMLYKTYRAETR